MLGNLAVGKAVFFDLINQTGRLLISLGCLGAERKATGCPLEANVVLTGTYLQ